MYDLEDADINLTPLLDVVFVILTIFIVAAPLLDQEEVHLAPAPMLSEQQAKEIEQQSPLVIHVHANNTISFNHQVVSLQQLEAKLREAYPYAKTTHPQLFQDEQASFGTYQRVKNIVAQTGFETLDVILQPGR